MNELVINYEVIMPFNRLQNSERFWKIYVF